MKKIAPAFFWILFFVFVLSNLPKLLEERPPVEEPQEIEKVEVFTSEQKRLLELHNENRVSKGLKPLELDSKLCDYAEGHADKMASKASMFHSRMSDLQEFCGADVVGENVAWGQDTEEEVVSAWMWSLMHRWNILGSSYNKAGFGVKKGPKGRNYWCVVFSS